MSAANQIMWAIAALAILIPEVAAAQSVPGSFAALMSTIEPGQEVIVTEADGRTTKGEVVELNGTLLTVVVRSVWRGDERRHFAESAVSTIRRSDSLWNGLLIGFGAGIAAAEVWRYQACGPRNRDDECSAIVFGVGVFTMVPGGAVAGALIDKFANKLVYRAPDGPVTLSLTPAVGRQQAGMMVTLRF